MLFVLLRPDIGSLFLRRSPTAIVRGVAFVVIYAINGVALGTDAHVAYEVVEIQPLRADSDPSATVIVPVDMQWGCAAAHHSVPAAVAWVGLLQMLARFGELELWSAIRAQVAALW